MIYLFTGSDVAKVRAKAFAWAAAARKKAPDAPYIRVHAKDLSREVLAQLTGAQGLFFTKTLALLDDPFSEAETAALVLDSLGELKDSPNPIAIVAPKLLAARRKKVEAVAEKTFVFDAAATSARGFNSALVNALSNRQGELLWKEIMLAFRQGDAPEAVHGLLHWKARDLMKKEHAKWGREGARTLSRDLIDMVSDARSGGLSLGESLERYALSLNSR